MANTDSYWATNFGVHFGFQNQDNLFFNKVKPLILNGPQLIRVRFRAERLGFYAQIRWRFCPRLKSDKQQSFWHSLSLMLNTDIYRIGVKV